MSEVHSLAERFNAADAPESMRPRTALLSVADIFAPLPPVDWTCEGLDFAPGAPLLVAGYGFSGKTVCLQDFALAVASGTLAWGYFPVRAGRVLHLDYEQGAYLTRWRYQRLARARGLDPAALADRLVVAPMPSWYVDSDPTDELSRLCEGFDLAIVDSFRAACPTTDENSSEARVPLDRMTRVSERTGTSAAVIHHARKPSQNAQGGARMAVRGSGALFDACGSVLVFAAEKGEPIRVAHEKARITGRPRPDFRLWIEDVAIDGDPTAGLRVAYMEGEAAGADQAPSDRFANLKRRVLEVVREERTMVGGINALRARIGGRKDDISAAVAELAEAGAILRGGTYREPTLTLAGTDDDSQ